MDDMRERIAIMTTAEMPTRWGGRLCARAVRARWRSRRRVTGEDEGDIDALHAGSTVSSQIR